MAQQVKIAGALFQDVPSISVPDANDVWHAFTDTSDADAVASDLALGKTAYAGGHKLTGTLAPVEVEPLSVTANGVYSAPTGHAYDPVTVNVEGGGGGGAGSMSDPVRFYDYDGALVYSYSAGEFLALDTMPDNPDHTDIGLTAQGWNWSLADAQEYVGKYGALNVGQMYIPTDGKTHLWIHIGEHETGGALTMTVRYQQSVSQGVTVDWGDGTEPQTYTGTSAADRTHTYAAPGDYEITLDVTSGRIFFGGSSKYAIYGSRTSAFGKYRIKRAWFGSGVARIGSYTFYSCYPLTSVTIPDSVTSIGQEAFNSCYSLPSVTIPDGVTSIDQSAFLDCYSLKSVTIPDSVTSIVGYTFQYCNSISSLIIPDGMTSIGAYTFYGCSSISLIIIPDSVTSIGSYAFNTCRSLPSVTIPNGVTSIGANAFSSCEDMPSVTIPDSVTSIDSYTFNSCSSLKSVTIPNGVTSIGANAFSSCQSLAEVHLRPTTPPTLASTNAFSSIPADCTMYVPYSEDHSILAAYQAATNWSNYASRMVEEPQS